MALLLIVRVPAEQSDVTHSGSAANGLIELHRRIAGVFHNRDNYRLRMLLIAGGLNL